MSKLEFIINYIVIFVSEKLIAEGGGAPMKKDEERGMGGRQVISNSHAAVRDGRPPPIPEEPEMPKEKEDKHEKSVLQAKLTKLAIQIGYAGTTIFIKHIQHSITDPRKCFIIFFRSYIIQALPLLSWLWSSCLYASAFWNTQSRRSRSKWGTPVLS